MTRDAVTRALTDEVLKYAVSEYLRLNQLAVWAGTGRNEGAALVRRLLLDALARAGLLAASPQPPSTLSGQCGCDGPTRIDPNCKWHGEAAAAPREERPTPPAFPHYFDKGRCSGHAQFNGRYCRDVAGPDQWCIHCAGFMLQQRAESAAATLAAVLEKVRRLPLWKWGEDVHEDCVDCWYCAACGVTVPSPPIDADAPEHPANDCIWVQAHAARAAESPAQVQEPAQ